MALNDLKRLHELRGFVEQCGEGHVLDLLHVHRTTLYRWLQNRTRIPDSALHALRAAFNQQLPYMDRDKSWDGWRFGRDGLLYPPNSTNGFHAGQLLGISLLHQIIAEQRKQIAALEDKLRIAEEALDRMVPAANDRKVV